MVQDIDKIAESLFEKIRSRFEDVRLGDEQAQATSEPTKARFFNFDYVSNDGENFGNVTVSIIDNESVKLYFSKNISEKLDSVQLKEWYQFLYEMRKFARRNLMTFDTRDISRRNLDIKDVKQLAKHDGTYVSTDVKVTESRLYGTPMTSFENIGTARLRILHTESVNPEVRGSRARRINAIYVENAQGERFRMEHNKLGGARALARHISEGGKPWDEIGTHINGLVKEMIELGTFVRGMSRRTFEDAMTTDMTVAATEHYQNIQRQLHNIKGNRGYRTFVESFEPQEQQLDEMDINAIKERFVKKIFDDRMTSALPHVYKAYHLKEQSKQRQLESVTGIITGSTPLSLATNEGMDEYMKMLRFNETADLVKHVLEDIANRAVTMPEVAGFAKHWANNFTNISEQDDQTVKENKTLAVQLATHYLRDLRNIKENSELRYQAEPAILESDLPDPITESTWAIPETDQQIQDLSTLLQNPLVIGVDAENAVNALYGLVGDDELFDALHDVEEASGPETDARPTILNFLKTNWPGIYATVANSNQEMDTPPPMPTQPPPPKNTMAANQPPGQSSGGVVSEDAELLQMLRIAGLK